MPELPDIELYLYAIGARVLGAPLERIRLANPFLLRSVEPPLHEAEGRVVVGLRRLGKRVVLSLDGDLHVVIHLMIAGRFSWRESGARIPRRSGLAGFDFPAGTLVLTEAGSKRRASLHLVEGDEALAAHDPCGLEVLEADLESFATTLASESHTLKRALTDPRLFSGIGNAYSDEILHRARLSPFKRTGDLDTTETRRLFEAARETLVSWSRLLREETGDRFPKKVTAFRPEMAVHGRYNQPCPDCATPVQRIVYAENEANYCPTCQTEGRLLADRALSRLLRDDWPRTIEELERRR